ncbi:ABC transporter ATP-binding protein [Carnobacterium gallinarum]|uniref:ABC transporter ATP-binding protein n=1 Tax=Carnobacterium gallinarum TaxID=2749 RepID=UPI00054F7BD1|nr:ABC transporter ATP-binding protein [Carnobacterium gallinarum]
MFEFEDVWFKRQNNWILKEINWQVKAGERWGILGLNGSGKTTLMQLINGYMWASEGKITVFDQVFGQTSLPDLRQSIGWVSSALQQRLYEHETAEEIVASGRFATIGLHVKATEELMETAKEQLRLSGGAHLIGKGYEICSQGQRQLILIARALMAQPKLLILDEPCTGLDLVAKRNLLNHIEEIAKNSPMTTLLYITHHTEELLPCFDKMLLLKEGQIVAKGATHDLLTKESLSAFLGEPINFERQVDGQVTTYLNRKS